MQTSQCLSYRSLQARREPGRLPNFLKAVKKEEYNEEKQKDGEEKEEDDEEKKKNDEKKEEMEGKRRDEDDMQDSLVVEEGMMVNFPLAPYHCFVHFPS